MMSLAPTTDASAFVAPSTSSSSPLRFFKYNETYYERTKMKKFMKKKQKKQVRFDAKFCDTIADDNATATTFNSSFSSLDRWSASCCESGSTNDSSPTVYKSRDSITLTPEDLPPIEILLDFESSTSSSLDEEGIYNNEQEETETEEGTLDLERPEKKNHSSCWKKQTDIQYHLTNNKKNKCRSQR